MSGSEDDFDDDFMAALDASASPPPPPPPSQQQQQQQQQQPLPSGGGDDGHGAAATSDPAVQGGDRAQWRHKKPSSKKLPDWMLKSSAPSSRATEPQPVLSAGRSKGLVQRQMDREFEEDQLRKRRRLEDMKEIRASADGNGGTTPLLLGNQPTLSRQAGDGGRSVLLTQALFPRRLVVFDVESTGFANDDVIVELGAVELVDGVRTGAQFHSYVQHRKESVSFALQVHGLDAPFLADKPPAEYVIPSFIRWVADAALVGHNVAFDARMLDAELKRLALPSVPSNCMLCTKQLFGLLFPNCEHGRKLDDLVDFFGIKRNNLRRNAHGALLDADLTAEVLLAMLSSIPTATGTGNGNGEGGGSPSCSTR
eukprot:COSAG05_NODE_585_length_8518_cov_16.771351_3_plen_368_part_00